MTDPFVERVMDIVRHRVDRNLKHELQVFPRGKVLYVRYGRFVLEKVQLKYLKQVIQSEDDIWKNYIIPLRRRLSSIRNPIEWRIGKITDGISTTMS